MGDSAAWFLVWLPRKEEERRLIQAEKEKRQEEARKKEEQEAEEMARLGMEAEEAKKGKEVVGEPHQGSLMPEERQEQSGSSSSVRVIEVQEVGGTQSMDLAKTGDDNVPASAPPSTPAAAPQTGHLAPFPTITSDPAATPASALPATPVPIPAPTPDHVADPPTGPLCVPAPASTPVSEEKLEDIDHSTILTLEELLNKCHSPVPPPAPPVPPRELSTLTTSGLTWLPSRDKTTILAMFFVG